MSKKDEENRLLGTMIANLFNLKKNSNNRYDTTWGDKTEIELGYTIKRIVEEKRYLIN